MNFLNNEIRESRLFRSNTAVSLRTAEDIKNITFLYLMALCIMKGEFLTAPWVIEYLENTYKYGTTFTSMRRSGNDLYWSLFIIFQKKYDLLNPKFEEANKLELSRSTINQQMLTLWVRKVIKGKALDDDDRRFFLSLEKTLNINIADYKSLRRLISNWDNLNNDQRSIVCTRLYFAMNKFMRMSEIFPIFEEFVKKKQYMLYDVADPENPINKAATSKNALNTAGAVALGVGGGLVLSAIMINNNIKRGQTLRDKIKAHFEQVQEDATSSASIASVAAPMLHGDIIKRPSIFYAKRGNRKKK